jgi:capsular exopolysaccharide synthesis family protein
VIDDLGLKASPAEIAGRFSAVPSEDSPSVTIFATAPTPGEARNLANSVIGALADEAASLESAARPSGAPVNSPVKLVPSEQAALPSAPTSPSYPINMLAGGLIGIVLGYALALVRRQLDSRIRTVDDMESLVGTSVLTILPESEELDRLGAAGIVQSQTGPAAEALRQLRTNLRFVDVDNPPQSIVVTSANAGEGKSVVTANLARVLAAAGQKTMLIDGDLRRPMVSSIFDLDPAIGLTQVLAGDLTLEHTIQDPGLPNLRVIVAGRIPPNPSELLGSQRMQHMIEDLVSQGYLVLIDAPPLLPVTDAGPAQRHGGRCDPGAGGRPHVQGAGQAGQQGARPGRWPPARVGAQPGAAEGHRVGGLRLRLRLPLAGLLQRLRLRRRPERELVAGTPQGTEAGPGAGRARPAAGGTVPGRAPAPRGRRGRGGLPGQATLGPGQRSLTDRPT